MFKLKKLVLLIYYKSLKDAGLKLKDLKTEQSTLEKIFVNLVKENNEI
jgi:ABC-2 type transport system ATP-binding protein